MTTGIAMEPLTIAALINVARDVFNRLNPDASEEKKQQFTSEMQAQLNDAELQKAQLEVNKIEASHPSIFVSGWRPAIGWMCAIALAAQFIFLPILFFVTSLFHKHITVQSLDLSALLYILAMLLGMNSDLLQKLLFRKKS